jgi:hypothetical protein
MLTLQIRAGDKIHCSNGQNKVVISVSCIEYGAARINGEMVNLYDSVLIFDHESMGVYTLWEVKKNSVRLAFDAPQATLISLK